MITSFRLTKTCLDYGWATKSAVSKTNKQKKISPGQQGSKHDSMMKERQRQPSTGQKRKKNKLADSNYFYTDKSILYMNFCTCITPLDRVLNL